MTDAAAPLNGQVSPASLHCGSATARDQLSPKNSLRIGLFGLFGSGNFGNDGSLEAMLSLLRKHVPNADLICICNGPERVTEAFGIKAIPMAPDLPFARDSKLAKLAYLLPAKLLNIFRAVKLLRNVDGLVVPGTGLLDDFSTGPLGIPLDLFCWSLAARVLRKPIWLVSIGAGPIIHPVSRWLMRQSARMAQYRSYRDASSKTFLTSIGVETSSDYVFPDLAFSVPNPKLSAGQNCRDKLAVGLGIMTYRGWRNSGPDGQKIYANYLDELVTFTDWLRDQDYQIRLLSGDDCDGETIHRFLEIVKSRRTDASDIDSFIIEPVQTLNDVTEQFLQTDFAVATRYHNVVCALKAEKPTISIGYAEKNRALLESANLDKYSCSIEDFSAIWLIERFKELSADRADAERGIKVMNSDFTRRLADQEALLLAKLARLAKLEGYPSLSARSASEAPG